MSDQSQGPNWWQASDGKWYPPEQAPGYQAPAGGSAPGTLDIGEALSYGWNKFVQYIGQVIVIVLIIVAVRIVFQVLSSVAQGSIKSTIVALGAAFFFTALGIIVSAILQIGLIRMGHLITDGQTPDPGTVFKFDNIGPFIIASILQGLLIFVGFFACCIGAIVVALFTLFYGYYVVDRNAAPVDSLTSSYNLVKDNLGVVLVFAIVVVLINLFTCGLGVGVTQIATAYAYRRLNGQPVAV